MILLPATVFGPIPEQVRSKTGYEFWGHGLWAGGGFWPLKQGPDLTPDLAKKWVQNRIFQKWGVFRSILGMVYYARAWRHYGRLQRQKWGFCYTMGNPSGTKTHVSVSTLGVPPKSVGFRVGHPKPTADLDGSWWFEHVSKGGGPGVGYPVWVPLLDPNQIPIIMDLGYKTGYPSGYRGHGIGVMGSGSSVWMGMLMGMQRCVHTVVCTHRSVYTP